VNPPLSVAVIAACPFPYPRGTPIRILRMSESLAARGHNVEVITYHLGQRIVDLPFRVHRIPRVPTYRRLSPGPSYQKLLIVDPLLMARVNRVLHTRHFDVIHAHHYEGLLAALPAARRLKIPVVFDVHTLLSSELPHYALGLPKSVLRTLGDALDRTLPRRADHIVAVTNAIRNRLMHEIGIPAGKITTVYTGAEAEHFNPGTTPDPQDAPRTLIYTGTLEEYQRIDLMLRAFRGVVDRQPDVRLKIVTDASFEPYENLVRNLRLGAHLDVVQADYFQLPQVLHSAMIALSPRVVCDGLPIKVLNYMATGRAIVAFAGSAEIVENGVTGMVVEDNDVEAFSASILGLLDDPDRARSLGRHARARVEEFFVWESAVVILEKIYWGLLKGRRA
jgi:glycosyltransferase involved in cell wall biosynthesis